MNYYRRFPGDYLADTGQLSLLQHGAYTLLLDHLYATEKKIATEQDAFRICRAVTEEERQAALFILENFFKKTTRGFTNNRFEKELKEREDWRKWQRNHRDRKPDSQANVRPMSGPNPSPSPSLLKDLKEEPPKGRRATALPEPFETNLGRRAYALESGVPESQVLKQLEAFKDYHRAKGTVSKDWDASWRTWCNNYAKYNRNGGNNGTRPADSRGTGKLAGDDLTRANLRAAGFPVE